MTDKYDDTSVRVAVRIRPQLAKERIDMCQVCTQVTPGEPQVVLGKDKAFTYDYVFDIPAEQNAIYEDCSKSLIDGCFEGYNATIFAYGQTGSGKTYTMGTGFDVNAPPEEIGIIPRSVEHLFNGIEQRKREAVERGEPLPDFKVNAQFMELYNEEVLDLLDTTRDPAESRTHKSHIKIHEDAAGGIYTVGVTTRQVNSLQDTIQCLKVGALSRTTASTNMNAQSSRSHAIFTLFIKQQRVLHVEKEDFENEDADITDTNDTTIVNSQALNEFETLTAKFHFVDLAGSERLKRTGATGDRQKEGISINCGLLALGNVISALGDQTKKGSHVPYRDSKLTRLLQDSLGGNSRTVMIACISPSDRDFMETLNALKYANRARNIKNKLVANQDKTSKQIQGLRMEIQALQVELLDYKTGKRLVDADGVETVNDMFHENTMLQTENENLRQRIKGMHETVETLTSRNTQLLTERAAANVQNMGEGEEAEDAVKKLIEGYVGEVEELRARLIESESMMEVVKRQAARTPSRAHTVSPGHTSMSMSMSLTNTSLDMGLSDTADIIALAKKDLKHDKKQAKKHRTRKKSTSSDKENLSEDEKQDHEYREHDPSQEKDEGEGSEEEAELEDEEEEEDDGEMEDSDSDSDSEDGLIALNKETKENVKNAADKNRILSTTTEEEEAELKEILDEDADNLHEDLADLTCEISIKQKLVEELELSQKRLHTMKVSYEEKLTSLQNRIRQTEVERDSVLSNLGDIESHSQEKAKKIKDEFEKKINDMQTDLKKVQAAKKEHAKLLRNQSHYEKQLKTLQRDLGEMKKLKVKLMNQIKEETTKTRQVESRRNREVMALKKEQRAKDNQIKTLTTEKRQKEIVLRRKQEEVEALRKRSQQRTMSARVAGRVGRYDKPLTVPVAPVAPKKRRQTFNPKAAKSKWDNLEKSVSSIIVKKQTLSHMEQDMERWIKQRESLSKRLEKFVKKKEHAIAKKEEESFIKDLEDQIDSLKDNIVFVQDNINECQSNIMQMEEAKAEEDDMKPLSVCNDVTLDEAKYLLEHFVSLAINKGLLASQKDSENKELMAKLHQERMDSTFQREMLQYLIQDKVDIEIDDSMLTRETQDSDSGSNNSSRSNSPIDSFMESQGQLQATNQMAGSNIGNMPVAGAAMSSSVAGSPGALPNPVLSGPLQTSVDSINTSTSSIGGTRLKARRHKTTPADLLGFALAGPVVGAEGLSPTLSPLVAVPEEKKITPLASPGPSRPATASQRSSERPSSASQRTSQSDTSTSSHNGMVADTATTLPPPKAPPRRNSPRTSTSNPTTESHIPRADGGGRPDPAPSPSLIRRGSYTKLDPSSPVMKRKMTSSTTAPGSLSRQSSINDTSDLSPPSSPSMARRNRDNNVFSRLTSQATPASPHPTRGVIAPAKTGLAYRTSPLIHTHTAGGHTKAVLSVYATEDLLFSSSKDRTAKIWDLATGEEILTLDGHPNNVVSVKYSEDTNLAYTVSTYFIKVWDPRQGNKCIKTLTSAGLTNEGPGPQLGFNARQLTCPPGEININDVALNSTGSVLYSAAGNTVRIWDLHSFKSVGKLSGGHQAAVMVLAVDDTDTADGNICVVTGSKDHYIKIFDVMEDSQGVLCPKYNLEPPHYDGIQSLCLMGDLLFSGSRDMCIKKWDLADQQLKQTMINAHKDWICGLSFMPGGNCLLSGCRGGYLKLWHIDNCTPLGEIQAHKSPINAICTNNRMIFTASNDRTVRLWTPRESLENSEGSDNE